MAAARLAGESPGYGPLGVSALAMRRPRVSRPAAEVMRVFCGEDMWIVVNGRIAAFFYDDMFSEGDVLGKEVVRQLLEVAGLEVTVRDLDLSERLGRLSFGTRAVFDCEGAALEALLGRHPERLWRLAGSQEEDLRLELEAEGLTREARSA